jgi:SHO1 osmosensor
MPIHFITDTANNPSEISFSKNEILDISDMTGRWWVAMKVDGTVGSKQSLYPIPIMLLLMAP